MRAIGCCGLCAARATIVRAILVPAVVAILGRWNWWLPHWPARMLRVKPSLVRREAAVDELAG